MLLASFTSTIKADLIAATILASASLVPVVPFVTYATTGADASLTFSVMVSITSVSKSTVGTKVITYVPASEGVPLMVATLPSIATVTPGTVVLSVRSMPVADPPAVIVTVCMARPAFTACVALPVTVSVGGMCGVPPSLYSKQPKSGACP